MKLARGIALAVLTVAIFTAGCDSLYSPSAAAEWEARKAVEAKLKSPSSAKFEDVEIAARSESEQLYVVYLVVDSQNGFGAMVRNHALALVMAGETNDDDSQVLHLEITEKSPPISRIQELTREIGARWTIDPWIES